MNECAHTHTHSRTHPALQEVLAADVPGGLSGRRGDQGLFARGEGGGKLKANPLVGCGEAGRTDSNPGETQWKRGGLTAWGAPLNSLGWGRLQRAPLPPAGPLPALTLPRPQVQARGHPDTWLPAGSPPQVAPQVWPCAFPPANPLAQNLVICLPDQTGQTGRTRPAPRSWGLVLERLASSSGRSWG